jgi:hypothetical protein
MAATYLFGLHPEWIAQAATDKERRVRVILGETIWMTVGREKGDGEK